MPAPRAFGASTYVENFGLVMAGNYESSSTSVIVTRDGQTFTELAPLPSGDYFGCMTTVDEQTLLYTGGYNYPTNVYSYDIPSNTWTT